MLSRIPQPRDQPGHLFTLVTDQSVVGDVLRSARSGAVRRAAYLTGNAVAQENVKVRDAMRSVSRRCGGNGGGGGVSHPLPPTPHPFHPPLIIATPAPRGEAFPGACPSRLVGSMEAFLARGVPGFPRARLASAGLSWLCPPPPRGWGVEGFPLPVFPLEEFGWVGRGVGVWGLGGDGQ